MANKIKCTCGHSWDKSDSSKKDAMVCHICGKNNMKNGGWLDKFDVPEAQNGIEGTMGGLTDQGFNYNGAWGGQFQDGGNSLELAKMRSKMALAAAFGNPSAKRMTSVSPSSYTFSGNEMIDGESVRVRPGETGTHYMSSMGEYAVPYIQEGPNGKLRFNSNASFRDKEAIRFDNPKDAQYFAEHYKEVAPMMKRYAMGGAMPGSVGFTYARTQGIPSEGPYAKKTLASAQDGESVKDQMSEASTNMWGYPIEPNFVEAYSKSKKQPATKKQTATKQKTVEEKKPTIDFGNKRITSKSDESGTKKPLVKLSPDELKMEHLKQYAQQQSRKEQPSVQSRGSMPDALRKQLYEDSQSAELRNQLLKGADIATDVMQVGNFVPHPIGQAIGNVGNILGGWVDAYQAYNAYNKGNYGEAAINAASVGLPMILGSNTFKRNSKYLKPGQPLYPLSPQAGILPGGYSRTQYIEPFTKVKGMTDKSLLANRALLGTLGAETVYDSYQNGGEMKFYQEGLDWKPRNISRDGSEIPQAQLGLHMLTPDYNQVGENIMEMLSFPQKALTKLFSGKYQSPSEAMGIKNKAGAIATDILLDPANLVGGTAATKIAKGVKAAKAANSVAKKVKPNFKSEIDWAKWNKEIPKNTQLMNEYNAIEQSTKKAGTWMKNPDGSTFKGTPEQFVQQNSQNFKKAFPQGVTKGYRGAHQHIDNFANRRRDDYATFLTDNKVNAETYATSDGLSKTYYHPDVNISDEFTDGIYELGFPQNLPKVVGEAEGRNWRLLNYNDQIAKGTNIKGFAEQLQDELKDNAIKQYGLTDYDPNKKYLSTDIYANYVKNPSNREAIAEIRNVKDQMGFNPDIQANTVYAIDANRTPLKSLRYNNGMFDMTNPNIYKSILPYGVPAAIGAGALQQKKQGGEITKDDNGYWNPENWGKPVEIGSNEITMQGVYEPLLGISDTGDTQMMYPGEDYTFDGESVTEYPVAQNGWLEKYAEGGDIVSDKSYNIQKGDTLSNISSRYNIPLATLANANQLENPNLIQAGKKLNIPTQAKKELTFDEIPTADSKKVVIDNFSKHYDYIVEGDQVYYKTKGGKTWADISDNKTAQSNLLKFLDKNNYWAGYNSGEKELLKTGQAPKKQQVQIDLPKLTPINTRAVADATQVTKSLTKPTSKVKEEPSVFDALAVYANHQLDDLGIKSKKLEKTLQDEVKKIKNSVEQGVDKTVDRAEELFNVGINGIKRKFATHTGIDDDTKIAEAPKTNKPKTIREYYGNKTGAEISAVVDVPDGSGRQFKQQVLPTSSVKFGVRNRGEFKDIKTDGLEVTTFNPFTKNKLPDNETVIAVDSSGNLNVGKYKDFKDNKNFMWSPTTMNYVTGIATDKNGKIAYKQSKKNPAYVSPITNVINDPNGKKQGSLNILVNQNKNGDYYGSVQGGRILVKNPDTNETLLISGSMNHVKSEFERIKGNSKYLEVYNVDNGTYSRGLSYKDKKLTPERLKKYDEENFDGGGNGLYIIDYKQPVNKFKEEYVEGMPNVRTEKDESYKKGHSLRNEIKNIVLHHTAYTGPNAEKEVTAQYMTPGQNTSHIVIQKNGKRSVYASPEQVTFHAGQSKWNNRDNVNDFSIGVEFQGDTNKQPLTQAQIESFVEYYTPLAKKYNLSLKDVITHQMIAPGRKPDIAEKEYQRILKYMKEKNLK